MDPDEAYEILRALSSPLVAITVRSGDRLNGMISNSAVRASLVPGRQRVANYVFKTRLTHEMLVESGRYAMHLLARDQWDVIRDLGFESGRERDKLDALDYALSDPWGLPILEGTVAWMRCEVVNVMDAGSSTFFMGDVRETGRGGGDELMDAAYFREHAPADWEEPYRRNLERAQEEARRRESRVDDRPWRRLRRERSGDDGP